MYIDQNGSYQIICDGCHKLLKEAAPDYIIVDGITHFCPPCFEKKERINRYYQRLLRIKAHKKEITNQDG